MTFEIQQIGTVFSAYKTKDDCPVQGTAHCLSISSPCSETSPAISLWIAIDLKGNHYVDTPHREQGQRGVVARCAAEII